MPGESWIGVQDAAAPTKKLRAWQRLVGADNVEEQFVQQAETHRRSYIVSAAGIPVSTVDRYALQLMAGAALPLWIKRIEIEQDTAATAAALLRLGVFRLTSAGTGGGGLAVVSHDTTDPAAGATAMFNPTTNGIEGARLMDALLGMAAAHPFTSRKTLYEYVPGRTKAWRVPAGTSNGLALKITLAVGGAGIAIHVEFVEGD